MKSQKRNLFQPANDKGIWTLDTYHEFCQTRTEHSSRTLVCIIFGADGDHLSSLFRSKPQRIQLVKKE